MIISILQKDKTTFNVYVSNNKALKYIGQNLIEVQGNTDKPSLLIGDFNAPLSVSHRPSKSKISKDIVGQKSTIDHQCPIDIYGLLHPTRAEHTFFSNSHGTFTQYITF